MASFALEHLTFSYPGQTRPALDDLTLTIPEGAVTVLCGESGSGKSTLLRQLKTCLTPHGETGGTVRFGGREARLTRNEVLLLQQLLRQPGQIVSRDALMNALWQSDQFVDDNTLTVNVTRLRRTLEELGLKDVLITRRGQGYQLLLS